METPVTKLKENKNKNVIEKRKEKEMLSSVAARN